MSDSVARLPNRTYLGVDEKAFRKGHRYHTIVCNRARSTVESVAEERTTASLAAYYAQLTDAQQAAVQAVAMDMWPAYIGATREGLPAGAEKIVFDRFHIMPQLFEIRRQAILSAASPPVAQPWADAHPPEWILEVIATRRVWVCEMGAGVVGWVSATDNRIDALYTRPDCVRQGIGSALLAFAEGQLRMLGFSTAALNASINAEGFYRSRGYVANGERHAADSCDHGSLPMRILGWS